MGVEEPDGFGDDDTVGVGVGVGVGVEGAAVAPDFLSAAASASALGSSST